MATYQIVSGTAYASDTIPKVIETLEYARLNKIRIQVAYGDTTTGKDWGDVFDIKGFVSRSTGHYKVPLLLYNSRSTGGGHMLDYAIVRIITTKGSKVLYQHPLYHKED